jgi:hypothetical protein
MSGQQIEELLQKYDPNLLAYMRKYYGNDPSFWEHEYNKHGTCFTTLRAKCQLPLRFGENGTSAALVGYFEQIVHQFKQLPSYDWLKEAGIEPSATKTYKRADMEQALRNKFGKTPYLYCPKKSTLSEIWYYYNVRGPLIHGQVSLSTTRAFCFPFGSRLINCFTPSTLRLIRPRHPAVTKIFFTVGIIVNQPHALLTPRTPASHRQCRRRWSEGTHPASFFASVSCRPHTTLSEAH